MTWGGVGEVGVTETEVGLAGGQKFFHENFLEK